MEGLEWKGVKKTATLIRELRQRCPTETRTQSNRTKIWCATITPWGNKQVQRNHIGALLSEQRNMVLGIS